MKPEKVLLCASIILTPYVGFAADVNITQDVTENTTWTKDNAYILEKPIFVTSGAELTIEPGTTIYGAQDTVNGTFGSLIITRGSKIQAEGTCDEPIMFTAIEARDGIGGVPLLPEYSAAFQCRTEHVYDGGDHKIIVGRVLKFEDRKIDPLIFCRGHFLK